MSPFLVIEQIQIITLLQKKQKKHYIFFMFVPLHECLSGPWIKRSFVRIEFKSSASLTDSALRVDLLTQVRDNSNLNAQLFYQLYLQS